jgi:hypothetical protein
MDNDNGSNRDGTVITEGRAVIDDDGSNKDGIIIVVRLEFSIRLAASHASRAAKWPILEACRQWQRTTMDTTIYAMQQWIIWWHQVATDDANAAAAAAAVNHKGYDNQCCVTTDDVVASRGNKQC